MGRRFLHLSFEKAVLALPEKNQILFQRYESKTVDCGCLCTPSKAADFGGLDPIVRDHILDMFLDFVQDEENSILVSSHITTDLEKVADYIVFIHEGRLIFSKPKDELLENYGIVKCGAAQFDALDQQDVIAYRKQDYEWQVLVSDRQSAEKKYPKAVVIPATIDEIMLLYVKGEVI